MTSFLIWICLAVLLGIADLFIGSGYILILALACLPPAAIAFFTPDILWQLFSFALFGIVGCFIGAKWLRRRKAQPKEDTQHLDDGQIVEVSHWDKIGQTKVFFRGAYWDAKAQSGHDLTTGPWMICGNQGNILILKPISKENA